MVKGKADKENQSIEFNVPCRPLKTYYNSKLRKIHLRKNGFVE